MINTNTDTQGQSSGSAHFKFWHTLKAAFPFTIPVFTGFICLGIAYGILMRSKGYSTIWAVAMSAIAFCGSMQFVAITLLTAVFNPLQAFLLSLMVNARHLFYGISMLDKYANTGKLKPLLIFTLCDETFSICTSVRAPDNINEKHFYFIISLLNYSYWVLGTLIGGICGGFVSFNTAGLDFALTALFVVLFLEQWHNKYSRRAALIGIAATVISLIIFGADNLVLPAMAIILILIMLGRGRE